MFLVLDTNTFLRSLARVSGYDKVLEKIKRKCDVIVSTGNIEKEYRSRLNIFGMSQIILLERLEMLRDEGKLKHIKRSKLRKIKICREPDDKEDIKFLLAALATGASYIITTDKGLTRLNPYKCEQICIRIIEPDEYIKSNC
jgi:predicted nucleic acid-binding protein